MKRIIHSIYLISIFLLVGCGQMGPLTLPPPNPPVEKKDDALSQQNTLDRSLSCKESGGGVGNAPVSLLQKSN